MDSASPSTIVPFLAPVLGPAEPLCEVKGGPFGVFMADPPWKFVTRSAKGLARSPDRHYPTMAIDEIKALPVGALAAKNSMLGLWTTGPHLELALQVMAAWGFAYSGFGFVWIKLNKGAPTLFVPQSHEIWMGLGYTTRKNAEVCLFGRRGHPKRLAKDVREVILSPRREHSRKPAEVIDRMQRLYPGPYLEMFSREPREGWSSWGNDVHKFSKVRKAA
jgi:N6-adenosine-specific RNA methylase IME4